MGNLSDTFRHKGLRTKLVQELRRKGIKSEAVLSAMEKIPRHYFFDSAFDERAYEDNAFPIGAGQTISQPYTVAFQSQLMEISKGEKVLEIGTGSGFQTAILIELGAKVYTIERIKELFVKAKDILSRMGYNPFFYYGDGYEGLPTYGPFNKILITAAAPYISDQLKQQLKIGGWIVAPLGQNQQIMTKITKLSETEFKTEEFGYFTFVPLLKGKI